MFLNIPTLLAAAPPATGGNGLDANSMFELIMRGGWAMVPIALCSVVAATIVAERLLMLRRGRVIPRSFVARLTKIADRQKAIEACRVNGSPIANVLATAIKHQGESLDRIESKVEEAGQREVAMLRHRMRLLSGLPQVATMLGLLGTVFGMIKTFTAVAASSEALGKTEMLAEGIYEAWMATAAGLVVAIPALVAYHMLMGRIDRLVEEIDKVANDWLEQRHAPAPVPSVATAVPSLESRSSLKPADPAMPSASVSPA